MTVYLASSPEIISNQELQHASESIDPKSPQQRETPRPGRVFSVPSRPHMLAQGHLIHFLLTIPAHHPFSSLDLIIFLFASLDQLILRAPLPFLPRHALLLLSGGLFLTEPCVRPGSGGGRGGQGDALARERHPSPHVRPGQAGHAAQQDLRLMAQRDLRFE